MAAMQAFAPRLDIPIRESERESTSWRFQGEVYFTFPHPLYPFDPEATRAMKEDVPDYVPLWGRWYFLHAGTDASDWRLVYKDRHVIARRVRSARLAHRFGETKIGKELFRSQLVGPEPAEGWPNWIEGPWYYTRQDDPTSPALGDFAPHGMEMVRFLRDVRVRAKPGETLEHAWKERLVWGPRRRHQRVLAQRRFERSREEKERQRYQQKMIDRAGETDFNRQLVERLVSQREVVYRVPGGTVTVKVPLPRIPGVTA